jgi:hypothetical protein
MEPTKVGPSIFHIIPDFALSCVWVSSNPVHERNMLSDTHWTCDFYLINEHIATKVITCYTTENISDTYNTVSGSASLNSAFVLLYLSSQLSEWSLYTHTVFAKGYFYVPTLNIEHYICWPLWRMSRSYSAGHGAVWDCSGRVHYCYYTCVSVARSSLLGVSLSKIKIFLTTDLVYADHLCHL